MKNKLNSSLDISLEVLSALPKNNINNTRKYIKEANKIYANYNRVLIQVISEMKQRNKIVDDNLKTEDIVIKDLSEYKKDLKLFNPLTTSFEKFNLDYLLSKLEPEQELELTEINQSLITIIKIFEQVGINLTESDFYYGKIENLYMNTIIDYNNYNYQKSKEVFEKFYWESPKLIHNIQLNIRSLYFKHQKEFDNYLSKYQKTKKYNYQELFALYQKELINNHNNEYRSSKIYLQKFVKNKLDLKDYEEKNIVSLTPTLIDTELGNKEVVIENLRYTLNKYKDYLKYKEVLDTIKTNYEEVKDKKISSNKILKEILKLDNKIRKQKTIEKHINRLNELYQEYDEVYYQEKLIQNFDNNSKLLDIIGFLQSYWKYFNKIIINLNNELSNKEIFENYQELSNIYTNPFNNILNHLDFRNGYNVEEIICDKYKLHNIKITEEDLDISNLDKIYNTVSILDNYNKIKKLEKIDYQTIVDYYNIDQIIKNIDKNISQN